MSEEGGMEARVMFGDPFGNRGDYSKGIFYSGRRSVFSFFFVYDCFKLFRRYLHTKQPQSPGNILEPPPDFMTLRQKKQSLILKKAGVQLLTGKIEFKKSENSEEAAAKLALLKRLEAMNKKKVLVIKTEPSSESEWKKETQAGCTFWVHKTTGIISTTRPFDMESDSVCSSLDDSCSLFSESNCGHEHEHGEDFDGMLDSLDESHGAAASPATGSLVYDPKPFDTLMRELDEMGYSS
jgi:hypothetical protein